MWNLIINIKDYFLNKAESNLIEETKEPSYDDNFHILYIQMLMAYHDRKSLNEIFMTNYRVYSISEYLEKDFKLNALSLMQIPKMTSISENANFFKYIIMQL